jgi:hypothetical protein
VTGPILVVAGRYTDVVRWAQATGRVPAGVRWVRTDQDARGVAGEHRYVDLGGDGAWGLAREQYVRAREALLRRVRSGRLTLLPVDETQVTR